jgi:hypothetical protein
MAMSSGGSAVLVLDDLKAIFGARLEAFVTYAPAVAPACCQRRTRPRRSC